MAFPTTDLEHGGRGDALVKVSDCAEKATHQRARDRVVRPVLVIDVPDDGSSVSRETAHGVGAFRHGVAPVLFTPSVSRSATTCRG
jgi:hypothetical protein